MCAVSLSPLFSLLTPLYKRSNVFSLFYNYFTFLKVYLNLYCPLISLFLLVFYFCNILGFFKRENKQR